MQSIKPGSSKGPKRRADDDSSARKTRHASDDGEDSIPRRRKDDAEVPAIIKVNRKGMISTVVPGSVFQQSAFPWRPRPFATDSERLHNKIVEDEVQNKSLELFLGNPKLPVTYVVSGNPSDIKAKYFAAFLVQAHMAALGIKANPRWYPLYEGYSNPIVDQDTDDDRPTMIVVTNVTPNATYQRLSKLRDIVEKFADIPRVIVVAGMDPLTFATTKLYSEVNCLAYIPEAIIKHAVEIG